METRLLGNQNQGCRFQGVARALQGLGTCLPRVGNPKAALPTAWNPAPSPTTPLNSSGARAENRGVGCQGFCLPLRQEHNLASRSSARLSRRRGRSRDGGEALTAWSRKRRASGGSWRILENPDQSKTSRHAPLQMFRFCIFAFPLPQIPSSPDSPPDSPLIPP